MTAKEIIKRCLSLEYGDTIFVKNSLRVQGSYNPFGVEYIRSSFVCTKKTTGSGATFYFKDTERDVLFYIYVNELHNNFSHTVEYTHEAL